MGGALLLDDLSLPHFPHPAAANALTMGGASLMGQPLKVELATEAKKGADAALAVSAAVGLRGCCYL